MIRLDKFISDSLVVTRKEAAEIIKRGRVTANGQVIKKADYKFQENSVVIVCDGKEICFKKFIYIVMNKPEGYVCSTQDKKDKTVLSLLPQEYLNKGVSPVGRLDKDTVGLLLLTNDGDTAHKMLSPKSHVSKKYYVECDREFSQDDVTVMRNGIMMDGKMTKPAILEILPNKNTACITLTEGKYHEIKRLCAHCSKTVTFLERLTFGNLVLDNTLKRGQWKEISFYELKSQIE